MVQTLAADSFQGRLTGTFQASKAALLISDAFKQAGALPIAGNDGYIMPFEIPWKTTAFNFPTPYKVQSHPKPTTIFITAPMTMHRA